MFVKIRNPWGVELCNGLVVEEIALEDGGAALRFAFQRREGGLKEWMCHEVRNLVNTSDWSQPPRPAQDTHLTLDLRPVTLSVHAASDGDAGVHLSVPR
jgi:hypothetical protein